MTLTVPGWVSPQFGGTASGAGPTVWNMDDPPPNPAIYAGYGSVGQPAATPAAAATAATLTPTPAATAGDGDLVIEISPDAMMIGVALALGLVLIATR